MARAGGADAAGKVRAGGRDGHAGRGDELAGNRVRRNPDGERIEARRDKLADAMPRARPPLQDQRQRPRPERLRQRRRLVGELDKIERGAEAIHMRDQRIEARPALGLENARHRLAVGGIGAQAVHRLGRERHEAAGTQDARGLGDCPVIRLNDHPDASPGSTLY